MLNILVMSVTLDVFQFEMSELKEVALRNILFISNTLDVFHFEISELKFDA